METARRLLAQSATGALDAWQAIVAANPDDSIAHTGLALARLARRDHDGARSGLERALTLETHFRREADIHVELGRLAQMTGDVAAATQHYQLAMIRNGHSEAARRLDALDVVAVRFDRTEKTRALTERFAFTGIPAVSADGQAIVLIDVVRPGDVGRPGHELRIRALRDGKTLYKKELLSYSEAAGKPSEALFATLEQRAADVARELSRRTWTPLIATEALDERSGLTHQAPGFVFGYEHPLVSVEIADRSERYVLTLPEWDEVSVCEDVPPEDAELERVFVDTAGRRALLRFDERRAQDSCLVEKYREMVVELPRSGAGAKHGWQRAPLGD